MVDMDSRILNKFFSETINISSPRVDGLTLQDGATAMGDMVTPAPPSSAIGSDSALILNLSDTNLLTSLLNLYNSANNSYLTYINFTV